MTYSIWLEPTAKDAEHFGKIIRALSKKYDAPVFLPHITLYSGIAKLGDARNAIRQCRMTQMRLRCTGVGHSGKIWKTVFVNVQNDHVLKLANKILKENLENKYEFRPHISLIYKNLDTRTRRRIARDIRAKQYVTFDRISVIKSSKAVASWKRKATRCLKKI
jgi:2'-5' RNA ligase